MSVSVNQSRLGDFELLEKLGEGGMGAVYKARQLSLDRIVAIKVLPRRLAAQKKFLDRFVLEARATAKLNHPNIVAGFDVTYADGYHYFVMEYVKGVTLRSLIQQQKGGLPETYVARVGAAMAGALAHAHKAGIIHRDVKPENILIDAAGVPKLTDLGLSKVTENEDGYLTQAGLVVGTAVYIAPEQARGEVTVDGRADIYALGCTLYHAVCGKPPFDAATPSVLMVKHISEKMPHPRSLRPDLSDEFCDCLARMVTRRPTDRYTAADAAKDLEIIASNKQWTREPLPVGIVNFLPDPSSQEREREREDDVRASRTMKRSVAGLQAARTTSRATPPKRKKQGAWTVPALIIAAVLLLASYLIATHVINTSEASYPLPPIAEHSKKEPAKSAAAETTDTGTQATPPAIPASMTTPATPAGVRAPRPTPAPPSPASKPAAASTPAEPRINKDAPLLLVQLDPNTDRKWRIGAPEWNYSDGVLKGAGQGANAYMTRGSTLPRNFELLLTIHSKNGFHFGWSGEGGGNFLQRSWDGIYALTYWDNAQSRAIEIAHTDKIPDGLHEYAIVVIEKTIKVSIDGKLVMSTNDKGSLPDAQYTARDLSLYASNNSQIEYRKIQYRDFGK